MSLLSRARQIREAPPPQAPRLQERNLIQLLSTREEIYHIKDLDALLQKVLLEARRFVAADAGTIYLVSGTVIIALPLGVLSAVYLTVNKLAVSVVLSLVNRRQIVGPWLASMKSSIAYDVLAIPLVGFHLCGDVSDLEG